MDLVKKKPISSDQFKINDVDGDDKNGNNNNDNNKTRFAKYETN